MVCLEMQQIFVFISRGAVPARELRSRIKDVRANCLCASLLNTQFMLQRHATSCTSARAKEEIYSHEGMVSVALTLLRFNSLRWSLTPTFLWIDDFLY